jgi:hypothetical protein
MSVLIVCMLPVRSSTAEKNLSLPEPVMEVVEPSLWKDSCDERRLNTGLVRLDCRELPPILGIEFLELRLDSELSELCVESAPVTDLDCCTDDFCCCFVNGGSLNLRSCPFSRRGETISGRLLALPLAPEGQLAASEGVLT